ncbi:MAG: exopolysaccharide biosynthesis protein [Caulobacteraceae bacterium]|nr:exopolysaccharide biosynthesis protein [Caulobacteraceae bacterium]
MSKPGDARDRALSASLRGLLHGREARLSFGQIVEGFEDHGGVGEVLFILTLPVLLPLPPGGSAVLALPLLMIALQIALGRERLWLPHWLSDRKLEREAVAKVARRVLPPLEWIEALGRPRLGFVTGRLGTRLAGAAATVLALVVMLPIPFGNLLPAMAVALLALGLARKDGLMVLGGYALMAGATGVSLLGAQGLRLLYHAATAYF